MQLACLDPQQLWSHLIFTFCESCCFPFLRSSFALNFILSVDLSKKKLFSPAAVTGVPDKPTKTKLRTVRLEKTHDRFEQSLSRQQIPLFRKYYHTQVVGENGVISKTIQRNSRDLTCTHELRVTDCC